MNSQSPLTSQNPVNQLTSVRFMTLDQSGINRKKIISGLPSITLITLFLLLFSASFVVVAADQDINKNWRSIAIKGYDPVAYFTLGKAVQGKSRFEYRWHDARWRFASEEHLHMFSENPERYAPRFGGYCAEGMALGRKASIDPQAWLIIDDELYLNYSVEVRDEMARDPEDTIGKADLVWEKIQSILSKP